MGRVVERYAERCRHVQWLTTGHLGPSPLVAQAILDRATAALTA